MITAHKGATELLGYVVFWNNQFKRIRGVLRTQSSIYDGAFLQNR